MNPAALAYSSTDWSDWAYLLSGLLLLAYALRSPGHKQSRTDNGELEPPADDDSAAPTSSQIAPSEPPDRQR